MTRLLVTAISGNVATGILRSLAGYDYRLYGCDIGEYPAGMDLVSDWFRVPYAVDADYVPVDENTGEVQDQESFAESFFGQEG